MRANAAPDTQALRSWQRRALVRYLAAKPRDFLAVATPGSGKTTFALRVAGELLAERAVDQITVVVPTEHLKTQWAMAAARVGIALDPKFSNSAAHTSSEYHGVVVTYAQVASHPARHRVRTENRRTLVVFDEIHHGGDAKSWGEAIREAFDDATRRLALTGTPFRSDDCRDPVRHLCTRRRRAACARRPTTPTATPRRSPTASSGRWCSWPTPARRAGATSAGEEHAARLGEPLNAEQTARAWRTALDPSGEWIPAVLQAADTRLTQLRNGGVPDAGAMVIASDQKAARAYAAALTRLTGETPTVVLSDDPGSSARIADFSAGTSRWLVAVRMVSEGVDVPRLAVGVYATSASTPLFFAQAIGRYVRSRRPGETASIFLPSVPTLLDLASQMEAQRDHVLGKPHRESQGYRGRRVERRSPNRRRGQRFRVAGRRRRAGPGHLRRLVVRHRHTGGQRGGGRLSRHPRPAGRRRDARPVAAQARRADSASAPHTGEVPRVSTHGQLRELRSQLNALVSVAHHRTGKPHGWIHNELRRLCGGPPIAAATTDQLKARIEAVRSLNT